MLLCMMSPAGMWHAWHSDHNKRAL